MDASSILSDDLSDYDVVSDPGRHSLESSIADLTPNPAPTNEPSPVQEAYDKFATIRLTANDIQVNTRTSLGLAPAASSYTKADRTGNDNRTKRVYIDGLFDIFNAGHALQLRQAKLSFPSVHLIAGVYSDELCECYGTPTTVPHLERCEILRHCRWVDEVLPDAPWQIDEQFLRERHIDYIVVEEGMTVDPACDKVRLKGYDAMKRIGKAIPTKRTIGITVVTPASLPNPGTPKSPPIIALLSEETPEPLVEF
ncbi:cholinephosphate cytidylyltransferase [Lentinula aff. lateritia]|uniref:Cholinephosphate cytidylyltransferase n=1 Tax=Lentinula aff. lateritia TaxID=2804960 RepID=A0ACC1U3J5_9AGAR|nr:cholinephosphate cytidylyltransferase [Lentinula aff. lateritia]